MSSTLGVRVRVFCEMSFTLELTLLGLDKATGVWYNTSTPHLHLLIIMIA